MQDRRSGPFLQPRARLRHRLLVRKRAASALCRVECGRTQHLSRPGNQWREKCLVRRVAVKPRLACLSLRRSVKLRSMLPLRPRRPKTGADLEHALSRRLGTDLLGDCMHLEQHRRGTIPESTADRNHCQIEKRYGDTLLVPQLASQRQYIFVKRLSRIQLPLDAMKLRQCVERGRELTLVSWLAGNGKRLLKMPA